MTLYEKLKKGMNTVLLSTAIYASTILPVQAQEAPQQAPPAQTQQAQTHPAKWELRPRDRQRYEQNPDAFTQFTQAHDSLSADGQISNTDKMALEKICDKIKYEKFGIYTPFEEYEQYFSYRTGNGKINLSSFVVEKLDEELAKAVNLFEYEHLDENKKPISLEGELQKAYLTYAARKKDLELLRTALKEKEEYLNKELHNNSFICFGILSKNEERINSEYSSSLKELLSRDFYLLNPPSIVELTDEFPIKTKIPFWPGFLFGLMPALLLILGKKRRKERFTENSLSAVLIQVMGSIFYDSLHPLAYPIRISAGFSWEIYKEYQFYQSNKKKNTTHTPQENQPTKPSNVDPWCELEETPKKEEKQIDPWIKLENKLQ